MPEGREELERLRAELTAYKLDMDKVLGDAKDQMRRAASQARATRQYADARWFQAIQAFTGKLGRESQRVQVLVGEAGRRIRKLNGQTRSFSDVFVDVARTLLPPAEFDRISIAAHRVVNPSISMPEPCSPTSSGS